MITPDQIVIGPPTSGTRVLNEFWRDALGGAWRCTMTGTPGTWVQIRPAAATADPSSGSIPTGYLIWNVADGAVKRHAGAYSWEITFGANASAKVRLPQRDADSSAGRCGSGRRHLCLPDGQRPAFASRGSGDQSRPRGGDHPPV